MRPEIRLAVPGVLLAGLLAACGPTATAPAGDAAVQTDAAAQSDTEPQRDSQTQQDATPPVLEDVDVVITADNAFSFGYGDVDGISTFIQGTRAYLAGEIFNCPVGTGPEHYVVPGADAPTGAYLYIASWDDLSVTQGVLGQFKRGAAVLYTGDAHFEVCATGLDYSGNTTIPTGTGDADHGPTVDVINQQIAICNAGTGAAATTSQGWVSRDAAVTAGAVGRLAVGEANSDAGGTFPIACQPSGGNPGIDAVATWMWYDPQDGLGDAFHSNGSNRFKAFLIFRLPADEIIIE
jgi:hypothetical protein